MLACKAIKPDLEKRYLIILSYYWCYLIDLQLNVILVDYSLF